MPSCSRVRRRDGGLRSHAINAIDPVGAASLRKTMEAHVKPKTHDYYDSCASHYFKFCDRRKVDPFPADPVWFCAWMDVAAKTVAVKSIIVYMSAIKSAQEDAGLEWELTGNFMVHRTLNGLKHRYGMSEAALKVPISLDTLLLMCKKICGWPLPRRMSHNDRLFVAASVIGVSGFLRGGEFLFSKDSSRRCLTHEKVVETTFRGEPAVIVHIVAPKAKWWLLDSEVMCFQFDDDCPLNPSTWLRVYRRLSCVPFKDNGPAFVLASGGPLSKAWMLNRTTELLKASGIVVQDGKGDCVPVRASSWRAGGVQSAKLAGLGDGIIKALGRWSSLAWMCYLFPDRNDLRKAASSMWRAASSSCPAPGPLVVGSFAPRSLPH